MTYVIPQIEPTSLLIGDTWTWQRTFGDYPAPTWTLTYYFKKADYNFSVICTAVGQTFQATVLPAANATFRPGSYRWTAVVSDGAGNRYTLFEGETVVLVDPAAVGNVDYRTTAQKIVEACYAAALSRAPGRQTVSIDGITMVFESAADAIRKQTYWQGIVESEQNADGIAKGLGSKRTIRIRM